MNSKLISAEYPITAQRWQAPGVSDEREPEVHETSDAHIDLLTAQQLEQIQQQAWDEGYASGRQEGLAAGREEIVAQVRRLAAIADELARPFEQLDEQVEAELLAVIVAIARQLVRRELKAQPDEIVAVVRRALQAMPSAAKDVQLMLNPEDAALVRDAVPGLESEHGWRIVEDSTLSRGGCRIDSESSRIDATVEHRLNEAVAAALGGQRRNDPSES